jgi:hypothetical protein
MFENSQHGVRNKGRGRQVVLFMKKISLFGAVFAISGLLGGQLFQPASFVRQVPAQASILVGSGAEDMSFRSSRRVARTAIH